MQLRRIEQNEGEQQMQERARDRYQWPTVGRSFGRLADAIVFCCLSALYAVC